MKGFRFTKFSSKANIKSPFEKLKDLFMQLLHYTSGDATEALKWLSELDREHKLTDPKYSMADFINDLKVKGYLNEADGKSTITALTEQALRKGALEEIFGKLKKSKLGDHSTKFNGVGDEHSFETRPFAFGDAFDQIDMTASLHNAQIKHGIDHFMLSEADLEVYESSLKAQSSTVLMIDISHSMILYGEDRITPAKKVAMALSELITTRYPNDSLDIIVFGNDAWQVNIKDLPYLQVGPYHTNTVAGLELAMELLRKKRSVNKQIFMITDGKPSCIKQHDGYYMNSFGLDRKIVNKCLNMANACKKLKIPITTFMIADDNYLRKFVREFTEANGGKAFYTSLEGLGDFVFEDFERNRRKRSR